MLLEVSIIQAIIHDGVYNEIQSDKYFLILMNSDILRAFINFKYKLRISYY